MIEVRAKDYIETAFSAEDAELITPVIDSAVAKDEKIVIDFSEITFFTTLFFSSAITRIIKDIGEASYHQTIEVKGLTKVGQAAYQHSLDYALEAMNMSPEEKRARLFAIDSSIDED